MHLRSTVSLALVLLASCNGVTGTESSGTAGHGPFTTDASTYVAQSLSSVQGRYAFTVIARYTNTTALPIYLARCFPNTPYPTFGVQLTDGSNPEGAAYDMTWGCVGHNQQILVAPGVTRVDTLTLSGPNSADGITHRYLGTLTGRFRLVYEPQTCTGDGQCLIAADSLRYSSEFTVRMP
jgi:hypothetical protein